MKLALIKIGVVFSFAAMLCILMSCESTGSIEAKDIVTSFSGKATVKQGDNIIECDICRSNDQAAKIVVTKPEQISGFEFKWLGEENGITYGELQTKTSTQFLPDNSFAQAIINVLNASSYPENLKPKENIERKNEFTGICESGDFKIDVTNQGIIEKIYIEKLELEVSFSEVAKI